MKSEKTEAKDKHQLVEESAAAAEDICQFIEKRIKGLDKLGCIFMLGDVPVLRDGSPHGRALFSATWLTPAWQANMLRSAVTRTMELHGDNPDVLLEFEELLVELSREIVKAARGARRETH